MIKCNPEECIYDVMKLEERLVITDLYVLLGSLTILSTT